MSDLMSNQELQEAINQSAHQVRNNVNHNAVVWQKHLKSLLAIQLARAEALHVDLDTTVTGGRITAKQIEEILARAAANGTLNVNENEPPWVEWDGSSEECPVPAGHDVEVQDKGGNSARDEEPEGWEWSWLGDVDGIVRYRDWTAWETIHK